MEAMQLAHRYAVKQLIDGQPKQVGVVTANNISGANWKALRLFNSRVWVERL